MAATEAMAVEEEVAVEEAVVGVGEAMAVEAVTPMAEAEVAEAMMMMKIPCLRTDLDLPDDVVNARIIS